MLRLKATLFAICATLLLCGLTVTAEAQKKENKEKRVYTGAPVMWRIPQDIESRNLLLGAGGEAMKPDLSSVTFIEQKTEGWSTKYRVRDGKGNEWMAKLSKEAQPEAAANRLLWAIGYETEVSYLVPELEILGKGKFKNVRLEARPKNVKRTGSWLWTDNPFVGKQEFQGLKIMMTFINNWDMKDDNNQILATKGKTNSERRFIVSDLGATFGKTGGVFSRSRNKPSDYAKADFIKAVNGTALNLNYSGKNQKVFEGITVNDARWLATWLRRLSDEQIKDAFRAANYSNEDVELLAGAVKKRIDELSRISAGGDN
jgi:hypothetical protein